GGAPGGPGRGAAAEHLEHPRGDDVTADDVHGGERGGHEGEDVAERVVRGHRDEHGARQDDAVDRVRRGHQRGVQGRGHLADDLEPDQQREHEDGDIGEQFRGHGAAPPLGSPVSRAAVSGWTTAPSCVMTTPAWISSVRSMASSPSATICSRSALTLRANAADAAVGTVAARMPAPITVAPFSVTVSGAGTEPATWPPSGPGPMSTITEPAAIALTASQVTSSGGRRPGTCAVVMTTSCRAMWLASSACCACRSSSASARAYPPSPAAGPTQVSSIKVAPSDSTSVLVCGRTSEAEPPAPSRLAVPMACSPATPVPSTSTLAGRAVPAAVMSSGKNLPNAAAPMSAAL